MGVERQVADPCDGIGATPKLSLAGRFDVLVDGRPATLVLEDGVAVFRVRQLRHFLRFRSCWKSVSKPAEALLKLSDLRLLVQSPWLGSVQLSPRPVWITRWLMGRPTT